MNNEMNVDIEEVLNNLLEQNKQLTLSNAVLKATLNKMQEAGGSTPSQEEST